MSIRSVALMGVVSLTLSVAACGQASSGGGAPTVAPSAAENVSVVSDPTTIGTYSPPTVNAKAGDTVEWTFVDKNPHSVTSDDGASFDSTPMSGGQTFSHRFDTPGTYAYHCSIHPEMHGTVVVG